MGLDFIHLEFIKSEKVGVTRMEGGVSYEEENTQMNCSSMV